MPTQDISSFSNSIVPQATQSTVENVKKLLPIIVTSAKNLTYNPDLHFERQPEPQSSLPPINENPIVSNARKILSWVNKPSITREVSYHSAGRGLDPMALRMAIVGQESGGDYSAISTHTDSRGNHSYGKYQILGSNIPVWTKEALGKSMTPSQFLKDTSAQDKVFAWHLSNLMQKYGNINDIASVYFSGGPYEKNKMKKDKSGLTVEKYALQISEKYRKAASQLRPSSKELQS